jgi:protein AATF/BFR2
MKRPIQPTNADDLLEDIMKWQGLFHSHQSRIIQDWNDKVQLASHALLHKKFRTINTTILDQIEQIWNDRSRLIRRTQQIRGKPYRILGKPSVRDLPNEDEEIFDDTDFYQQLLKEIIESKIDSSCDPATQARQWLLSKRFQEKQKKPYEKKTTKGRQLRYTTHEKLVNFMVPTVQLNWHEERIHEIFSSLLGRKPAPV